MMMQVLMKHSISELTTSLGLNSKALYTVDETAKILNCSINAVKDLIDGGDLSYFQSPVNTRKRSIPSVSIAQYIYNNTKVSRSN